VNFPIKSQWLGLKRLDVYLLKKFIGTYFYAIMILIVISMVIDLSQKTEDFFKPDAPPVGEILLYFRNFAPYIAALLFPLFIFIAAIFFTSKLAYKTEVIAMLATGMSFQRFLRPYFIGGFLLCGLALWANHSVVPAANKQRLDFEDKYIHQALTSTRQNIHLRLTPELYIYVQRYDFPTNTAYKMTAETVKGTQLTEKIMSERAHYDSVKDGWKMEDVVIRRNNGLHESLETLPELWKPYAFKPIELVDDNDDMMGLTTPQLLNVIDKQKTRGSESLNMFYVELHKRSAQPFAGLVLVIIGACIASRKIRGGSGFHLALGIVISAVYIMLLQFSTTFSTKGGLNPFIAVWIPNVIFTLVALWLYRRQSR
jgi:lipopolysaccharide export system permease protein